ncbi:RNA-directed DNA polymerase from transposon X-element [Ceratobasidium sp. AG-Ba]|nr:RNA-directed DNA polymerase from transposon X-element [Ceratobasidium sp. AG-Ba]
MCAAHDITVPKDYFPSPDTALWETRTDQARTKVYADGSRAKLGVGAGAVLRVDGRTRAWTGFRLGDQHEATVIEAELVGIWLALHLVHRLRYTEEVVLYCDSQLAIACIEGAASGAPKSLVRPIRTLISRIRERRDCTRLSIKWCPAHREILGNILADKEAKLAAKGEQYAHNLIPQGLQKYRHRVSRAVANELTQMANRHYVAVAWRNTPAGQKLLNRIPGVDPQDFLRLTARFNRSQITLLFRLLSGHVQLQQHLHVLRLVDSPKCRACGHAKESVSHFVLHCPKYADIRQHVLTSRGRDFLSFSFLFSRISGLKALLEYVRRTSRFKDLLRP